jgi:PAS domain S-box-containing protein
MIQAMTTHFQPIASQVLDDVGRPGLEFPWQLVLENTIVGVGYMQERKFLWANARMAEIFGYLPGEMAGMAVRHLYASIDDYEDVGRLMAHAQPDAFVTHERAMACKDGSLIWCRISGRFIHPGQSWSPSVWVVQDLSDKKQAENALRRMNQRLELTVERRTTNLRRTNEALNAQIERGRLLQETVVASREKYRTLFRHMPLGVLVIDADGGISEFNRTLQTYLGAANKSRVAELFHDISRVVLPDGQTSSLFDLLAGHRSMRAAHVERFEVSWIAPSGKRREISVIGAPLTSTGSGTVFTFADVTDQARRREREHEQQEALAHAARLSLMGQMASALAHELGQPLNACQSYLSGLRHRMVHELEQRPEADIALKKAMDHLEQAGQIIRNVRGFVTRQPVGFVPVDLVALIGQTRALLELPVRSSGTRIDVVVEGIEEGSAVLARCNPVEIQQVLVNLIMNSMEAMDAIPRSQRVIVLRLHPGARGMLCIDVSDQGPGVSSDIAAQIFEPYVTSKPSGLGMGLMISRTILEAHGGSIKLVRSRGPGAVFRFTLPEWSTPK